MTPYLNHFLVRRVSLVHRDLVALEKLMTDLLVATLSSDESISGWVTVTHKNAQTTKEYLKDLPESAAKPKIKTLIISRVVVRGTLPVEDESLRFAYSSVHSSINVFVSGQDKLWVQKAVTTLKSFFKERQSRLEKVKFAVDAIILIAGILAMVSALSALLEGHYWLFLSFFLLAAVTISVPLFKVIGLSAGGGNVRVTLQPTSQRDFSLIIGLLLASASAAVTALTFLY